MKNHALIDYNTMTESDNKAKNIIRILAVFAIILILCELYILFKRH